MTFVKTKLQLEKLAKGDRLEVLLNEGEPLENVPKTAKEQGYDFTWPIMRGFYVGPDVSDVDYRWWVNSFATMMADPRFDELRRDLGMFRYSKTGAALDVAIKERMQTYRELADSFGLIIASTESPGG